jgi:hypothetical protein
MTAAFWVDDEYDRDQASDGVSRFGAYVRNSGAIAEYVAECRAESCQDSQTLRARFAAAVWETATTPVMAPGYVRRPPRLISARDTSLFGSVELVVPWPQPLASSRDWQGTMSWWDWPGESSGGRKVYREPDEDELAAHAYLMTAARLQFPLRPSSVLLPLVPATPGRR